MIFRFYIASVFGEQPSGLAIFSSSNRPNCIKALFAIFFVFVVLCPSVRSEVKTIEANLNRNVVDSVNWRDTSKFQIGPILELVKDKHLILYYDSADLDARTVTQIEHKAVPGIEFPLTDSGMPEYSASDNGASDQGASVNTRNSNLLSPFSRITKVHIDQEADPVRKAIKIYWGYQAKTNNEKVGDDGHVREVSTESKSKSLGFFREYKLIAGGYQLSQSPASEVSFGKSSSSNASVSSYSFREIKSSIESTGTQLREYQLLQFTSPLALNELSYFAAQHVSLSEVTPAVESQYSIYSPLLKSCRDALKENQSDPLIGTPLSFSDYFVFSELPIDETLSSVRFRVIGEESIFVPTVKMGANNDIIQSNMNDPYSISFQGVGFSGGSFSGATPIDGLQTNVEDTWIVRVDGTSPLSLVAYSYYYIGKENFLPYYKVNYDFLGEPINLVILRWGIFKQSGRNDSSDNLKPARGPISKRQPIVLRYDSYNLSKASDSRGSTPHIKVSMFLTSFKQQLSLDYLSEKFDRLCGTVKKSSDKSSDLKK